MTGSKGMNPPSVAGTPTQGGDARAERPYAKPWIWTDRMLATLETGVKGGKWYSLMDKVYARETLEHAWDQVKRNKGAAGVDGVSVQKFTAREERHLQELHQDLKQGEYKPQNVRRVWIPKPGSSEKRPLGIPTVKDRVVQTAMLHVLEPIFEERFSDHSYGFRPGRSPKDALRRVDALLNEGYTWVVDADIRSYFDTIDPERLLKEVMKEVTDGAVHQLLNGFLQQEIMEGMKSWKPTRGTPQGAVISPLLANIYLHVMDVKVEGAGYELTRFADDLVILCKSEKEAQSALKLLEAELNGLKLSLHPEKTRIVDATQRGGFEFLGYHFERGYRWPRRKSLMALKDKIRPKTKRANGHSLEQIIDNINPILRGWYGYFKHSKSNTFRVLDGWVRMRLRSILRKRAGLKGRGRGKDHQKWPNAFFSKRGLFTMTTAHARDCQSC
jgi:RNA-directed DNA polymerase